MMLRSSQSSIIDSLSGFPVVGLIGSRQVGKTTLARQIADQLHGKTHYLDLERPSDAAKLQEPELYLSHLSDSLVVIDEVQRKPELFPLIRSLVDDHPRNGRFLLLGSASPDLLRQSAESLAGRIKYHELRPFSTREVGTTEEDVQRLWVRGGYPRSFLADDDQTAHQWLEAFVATYLERDVPQLGIRVPAAVLRRFWLMLGHLHGQMWNASATAASLGVSPTATRHYLDILSDSFLVRQVMPYFVNIGKRLVKSPKVYIRDSGLVHSLLGVDSYGKALTNSGAGASFEGFVIEQILAQLPDSWQSFYYRTSVGAEIDLLLIPPSGPPVPVEVKLSLSPSVSRGFWEALTDLKCTKAFVVYPGKDRYVLRSPATVLPLAVLSEVFS